MRSDRWIQKLYADRRRREQAACYRRELVDRLGRLVAGWTANRLCIRLPRKLRPCISPKRMEPVYRSRSEKRRRHLSDALGTTLTWTPGGKTLLSTGFDGLYAISLTNGARTKLMGWADTEPIPEIADISSDGKRIAIVEPVPFGDDERAVTTHPPRISPTVRSRSRPRSRRRVGSATWTCSCPSSYRSVVRRRAASTTRATSAVSASVSVRQSSSVRPSRTTAITGGSWARSAAASSSSTAQA